MITIVILMDSNSYEIRMKGHMGSGWADWLGDREIREDGNDTILLLRDADRASFYGVLKILSNLDRSIVSVRILGTDESEGGES